MREGLNNAQMSRWDSEIGSPVNWGPVILFLRSIFDSLRFNRLYHSPKAHIHSHNHSCPYGKAFTHRKSYAKG
jgi:hypothetical protein